MNNREAPLMLLSLLCAVVSIYFWLNGDRGNRGIEANVTPLESRNVITIPNFGDVYEATEEESATYRKLEEGLANGSTGGFAE